MFKNGICCKKKKRWQRFGDMNIRRFTVAVMLIFLSEGRSSPVLLFLHNSHTLPYSPYVCLKTVTRIFLENFYLTIFCNIRFKD